MSISTRCTDLRGASSPLALLWAAGLLGLGLFASSEVKAASYYWDADGIASGNNSSTGEGLGGTGPWDTATLRWFDGTSDVTWSNDGTSGAVFNGTAGTVTLVGPITASGLQFDVTGYLLNGGTLALANGGLITVNGALATINSTISGTVGLTKEGAGTLVLTGANTYSGATTISGGVLQAADGTGLPANSNLTLDGGIFQSTGTFTRSLGTDAGQVQFTKYGGGFAAGSSPLSVNLGGSGASLNLGSGLLAASTLFLSSVTAQAEVDLQNAINLGTYDGYIGVDDNPLSSADFAKISGVISGAGGLVKTGEGTLVLTGANTFTGATTISEGALQAVDGIGLPTASNLTLNGGVFLSTGTFTRPLGSDANQVQFTAAGGGFAAGNSKLSVNLGGNGATVDFGSGAMAGSTLVLGSTTSQAEVEFQNGLNLGADDRTIRVDYNRFSAHNPATVSGVISGAASLYKYGAGTLILTGNNTYTGYTFVSEGVLQAVDGVGLPAATNIVFDGGVFQSTGTFARNYGDVPGGFLYTDNGGGFSAGNSKLTVNLHEGSPLDFGTLTLILGSTTSQAEVEFTNAIDLANSDLKIRVDKNPFSSADFATLSGVVNGSYGLIKSGAGTLKLSGANTYTGVTAVSEGKLIVTSLGDGVAASSLGVTNLAPTNLVLASGVTLGYIGSGETTGRGFTMASSLTLDASGTGPLVLNANAKVAFSNSTMTRSLTLDGANTGANSFGADLSVAGTLDADKIAQIVKNGVGTWVLSSGSTLKSNAEIDINSGVLSLGSGVMPSTGSSIIADGATLRWSGTNSEDLSARLSVGAGAIANLDVGANNVVFASAPSIGIGGGFQKLGSGTLTIAAAVSSPINVMVSEGLLSVNGSAGNIRIASGATLGGSGAVGNVTTVSGAQVAPGNSPGTLTAANVSLVGGTVFEWQVQDASLAAGVGYDKLVVTGVLDLTGASAANKITIKVISLSDATHEGNPLHFVLGPQPLSFTLATAGSLSSNLGVNVKDLFAFDVSRFAYSDGALSSAALWSVDWVAGSNSLIITTLPEPSAYGFALGALALAAAAARRRRMRGKLLS